MMRNRLSRGLAAVIFLGAIVGVVRFWPDALNGRTTFAPREDGARRPDASASTDAASASRANRVQPTADGAPRSPSEDVPPGVTAIPQSPPVQIEVRAPASVRAGESFEATVELDIPVGVRQLAFSVTFNKSVLQLVGASEGAFVGQNGAPMQFGAEEPSDGIVLVNLDVQNGGVIAGRGSIVVLKFQATRPGGSSLAIDNVTFVDNRSTTSSTPSSTPQTLITVD